VSGKGRRQAWAQGELGCRAGPQRPRVTPAHQSGSTVLTSSSGTQRSFDVEYISNSEAMVCYTVAATNIPNCDIWDGTNWNTPADALTLSGKADNLRLIPNLDNNLVVLMTKPSANVQAQVFDIGTSSWSNLITLETNTANGCIECFTYDGAWETLSDNFVAVWFDDTTGEVQSRSFVPLSGWSSEVTAINTGVVGGGSAYVEVDANPDSASDEILLAVLDDTADVNCPSPLPTMPA